MIISVISVCVCVSVLCEGGCFHASIGHTLSLAYGCLATALRID